MSIKIKSSIEEISSWLSEEDVLSSLIAHGIIEEDEKYEVHDTDDYSMILEVELLDRTSFVGFKVMQGNIQKRALCQMVLMVKNPSNKKIA